MKSLIEWYRNDKRDLPWRQTSDPYAIWISEVMLQQTQVATVIPYYHRWISAFPTVTNLAKADEQMVLQLWQGLGYYRRCRSLLAGAKHIVATGMPQSFIEWLAIPGVGRYTAGAIASIAHSERIPAVDGNVERVFARYTGCFESKPRLTNLGAKWSSKKMSGHDPGEWNQALMELGATVCKPADPNCDACPISRNCFARKHRKQGTLPIRTARPETVRLNQLVVVPFVKSMFGLRQIPHGEWWGGMWEFPRTIAVPNKAHADLLTRFNHTVTHHRIRFEAYLAQTSTTTEVSRWVSADDLSGVPMPTPQRKIAIAAIQRLGLGC